MSLAIDIDERLIAQAVELLEACRLRGETIVTAESCTGGLVAATLTAIPGSSDVFERGFVTYANTAKSEMLGVPYWLIERHGAVSEDVARAMAGGALTHSQASLAVAGTGVAGPDGGTPEKPVGAGRSRHGTVRRSRAARDQETERRARACASRLIAVKRALAVVVHRPHRPGPRRHGYISARPC
jgi:nicotinamide-nucleotide amidase